MAFNFIRPLARLISVFSTGSARSHRARHRQPFPDDRLGETRPGTLLIHCQTEEQDATANFWARAISWQDWRLSPMFTRGVRPFFKSLCAPARPLPLPALGTTDVYAKDLATAIERLEALGAHVVAQIPNVCVMQAPNGNRFYVFSPSPGDAIQA